MSTSYSSLAVSRRTCLAICAATSGSFSWAQPKTAAVEKAVSVGRATRLSVLTDRMVRCHVQRHLNLLVPSAERTLQLSTAESDRLMAEMRDLPSGLIRSAWVTAEPIMVGFLSASKAVKASDKAAVVQIADRADTAADAVDKVVDAMVSESKLAQAPLLQTTADLQRLTQHLSVHFLLSRSGIDVQDNDKEVVEARKDFGDKLASLRADRIRTGKIDSALAQIDSQWLFLKQATTAATADGAMMQNACTTSERTLEVLTELYGLYEQALRQG
jgi:hypothetical protein